MEYRTHWLSSPLPTKLSSPASLSTFSTPFSLWGQLVFQTVLWMPDLALSFISTHFVCCLQPSLFTASYPSFLKVHPGIFKIYTRLWPFSSDQNPFSFSNSVSWGRNSTCFPFPLPMTFLSQPAAVWLLHLTTLLKLILLRSSINHC